MGKFVTVGTCVGLPGGFISYIKGGDARPEQVSYRWFAEHADLTEFRGWRLSVDWHVSFWKSRTPSGASVLYFAHSGIEHVFLSREDANSFNPDREADLADALDY